MLFSLYIMALYIYTYGMLVFWHVDIIFFVPGIINGPLVDGPLRVQT